MSDQNNASNGTPPQTGNATADSSAVIAELKKANETLLSQMNNMKSEFNRKMTNIEQRVTPKVQEIVEEESLEDLVYSNPKKFTEKITQQAQEAANRALNHRQKDAEVISNLIYEYPELQDKNSELFKQAVKVYENMSPEEQNNPLARKLAVKEAAMELEVKPRHKRSQQTDDFSMDGSSAYNSSNRSNRSREKEVSDQTLAFAQAVGMNVNDPKVVEALKIRSQRKNWNRYE